MIWVRRVFEGLVGLAVMLLVANVYAFNGQGFGMSVPAEVYYAVFFAVFIVPVFWAIMHLAGGLFFGIAAGGLLDGIRLGLTLGVGMALGKLWPYFLAAGAGVFVGRGPLFYTIVLIICGILLFGLDRALHYFWKSTTSAKEQP